RRRRRCQDRGGRRRGEERRRAHVLLPLRRPGGRSMHCIRPNVVALVGVMTLATPAFAQPASDHLACYLVKDTAPKGRSTLTLAPGPCDFNSDTRRCEGTCGNGGHCSAVTSGGACECRTTACGDADAPECNGFCDPGQACTFYFTECKCLDIP